MKIRLINSQYLENDFDVCDLDMIALKGEFVVEICRIGDTITEALCFAEDVDDVIINNNVFKDEDPIFKNLEELGIKFLSSIPIIL